MIRLPHRAGLGEAVQRWWLTAARVCRQPIPRRCPTARSNGDGGRRLLRRHGDEHMAVSPLEQEIRLPDGRVALAPTAQIGSANYTNGDLAPLPIERRTWNTYNYAALWIGMSHNIPSYLLASGLIAIGMNWVQAVMIIALGNLIVLVPMLLNSHAGTKYGIPFPVFARASFGVFGANFAAILRGLIACGWFGIQTWIGGEAIFTLTGAIVGHSWTGASHLGAYPWTQWLSFGIFWVLEMAIILRGMDTLRRFENWAAPVVLVVAVALLIFMVIKANGFGGILSEPSRLGWGSHFWPVFFPSLMGMIAFCWVVGFATALILYTALSMFSPQRQLAPATAPAS